MVFFHGDEPHVIETVKNRLNNKSTVFGGLVWGCLLGWSKLVNGLQLNNPKKSHLYK